MELIRRVDTADEFHTIATTETLAVGSSQFYRMRSIAETLAAGGTTSWVARRFRLSAGLIVAEGGWFWVRDRS